MVADGDALAQLAQARIVELVPELRLSDENDLQELALVGLEVREESDLLEELGLEILRLVDEEHDVVVARGLVEEILIQEVLVPGPVELARPQPELDQDRSGELGAGQDRIQDQSGMDGRTELLEHRACHGRLARSDFPRDLDEALALPDAEEDVVERLPMLRAEEQ